MQTCISLVISNFDFDAVEAALRDRIATCEANARLRGRANQYICDDVSGNGTSVLRPDRRGHRTYIPPRRATVRSKCLAFLNLSGKLRASLNGSFG